MIQGEGGSLGTEFLDNTGIAAKNMQTHLTFRGSTVKSVVVLCFVEF